MADLPQIDADPVRCRDQAGFGKTKLSQAFFRLLQPSFRCGRPRGRVPAVLRGQVGKQRKVIGQDFFDEGLQHTLTR